METARSTSGERKLHFLSYLIVLIGFMDVFSAGNWWREIVSFVRSCASDDVENWEWRVAKERTTSGTSLSTDKPLHFKSMETNQTIHVTLSITVL